MYLHFGKNFPVGDLVEPKTGNAIAEFDPTASVNAAALTETVGDVMRYVIDHKINLARQRSALLPLVNAEVAARRVSIFNDNVHGKFPLRGLKLKNATGQNLLRGPVSLYEGGAYAGDARLPGLQAGEERLLSFAVDQGIEVKAETKGAPDVLTTVRIVKGVVEETHRMRKTTTFRVKNRNMHGAINVPSCIAVRGDSPLQQHCCLIPIGFRLHGDDLEVLAPMSAKVINVVEYLALPLVAGSRDTVNGKPIETGGCEVVLFVKRL